MGFGKLLSAAAILLIGLIAFVNAANQLQCYSCNSAQNNNAACLDPLNKSSSYVSIVNCTSGGYVCTKVAYIYRNTTVVSRNCDRYYTGNGTCQYISSTMPSGVSNFRCSTCASNLCNSGNSVTTSVLVLIFGVVLMKALS